jgi:hypothetical protein
MKRLALLLVTLSILSLFAAGCSGPSDVTEGGALEKQKQIDDATAKSAGKDAKQSRE